MSCRGRRLVRSLCVCSLLLLSPVIGSLVHALPQAPATSAPLSGYVMDNDGALVPRATVTLKNIATGAVLGPILTNARGEYSFPGLAAGQYKVTIWLARFNPCWLPLQSTTVSR